MQNLYTDNYKIWAKETKEDLNKMERIFPFISHIHGSENNIGKMPIIPTLS